MRRGVETESPDPLSRMPTAGTCAPGDRFCDGFGRYQPPFVLEALEEADDRRTSVGRERAKACMAVSQAIVAQRC